MREKERQAIREKREAPLISVIGATAPSEGYSPDMGIRAGYLVREFVGRMGGTVFTGGVSGVGSDTYLGVMKFCIDQAIRSGEMPDDKFFVLAPKYEHIGNGAIIPYLPPSSYLALGALTPRGSLDLELSGEHMSERRQNLSEVGDIFLMLNGGFGTLDEANLALQAGKQVITLPFTGGGARVIERIKSLGVSTKLRKKMGEAGVSFDETDMTRLYSAHNHEEMIRQLETLVRDIVPAH